MFKKIICSFLLFSLFIPSLFASASTDSIIVTDETFNLADETLVNIGDSITLDDEGNIATEPQKTRCATCGTTKMTLVSTSKTNKDKFLSYHPDFKNWQRLRSDREIQVNPSRKGNINVSLNINGKVFGVGVSYSKKGGNENIPVTYKNGRNYYRPKLVGDTYTRKYKLEHYSNATGKLVKTEYKTYGYTKNVSTEIAYKE